MSDCSHIGTCDAVKLARKRKPGGEPSMRRTLHCLAFGREGAWQAFCLDLDLAVEGRTFEDADARLRDAIATYFQDVAMLDESDRERLLNRSMPLWTRVGFAVRAFLGALPNRSDDGYQHQFTMPSPA